MAIGTMLQARIDQDLVQVHRKWASETVNQVNSTWGDTKRRTAPIAEKEAEIRSSKRWNSYEKQDRLIALSRELDPVVAKLEKQRQEASDKLVRLRKMLSVVTPPYGDELVREIRNAEHRAVLRAMPDGQRIQVYLRAAEDGNVSVLHALLDSPDSLLPAEARTQGLALYHSKFSEETWTAAQQTEIWVEQVTSLAQHFDTWVNDLQSPADIDLK